MVSLLVGIPVPAHPGEREVDCVAPRVEIGDVRVYAKDLYVNWVVDPWAHPPCPFTRTGVMLGRSPSTLRPVAVPVTEQRRLYTAYSAFVPLDLLLEEAWIAAYAVDASGEMISSRPRMVSGALVTMAPTTVRVPDASRVDSCHMNGVTLGTAPIAVDGFVSLYWRFKRARGLGPPCGKITQAGVLMAPTPTRLWLVPATKVQDILDRSEYFLELPAPQGDTVWVVAYITDGTGYEFRSAPEQVMLGPSGHDYHVDARHGVGPIFEHDGSIWALMHKTQQVVAGKAASNETRSSILRRSHTGQWEVITSLFGEPLRWVRLVHVDADGIVFVAEDRVYRWRSRDKTWTSRLADYTAYFAQDRIPIGSDFAWSQSLSDFHARRVRIGESRYLVGRHRDFNPLPGEGNGIYRVAGTAIVASFVLPQPTVDDLKKYRPTVARDMLEFLKVHAENVREHGGAIQGWNEGWHGWLRNAIGPFGLADGKIWVGLEFYGGEGYTGIGGIAVFDPEVGLWSIHHHPLLVDSSITLLHPDGDMLWLATHHFSEGGVSPTRGLVRYDRRTKRAVSYHPENSGLCSWLVTEIRRIGNELWVGVGENGISILDLAKGTWTNYAIAPKDSPPNQVQSLGSSCTGVLSPREED